MRIWKIAALAALALSSVAAVAPTKSELEEMYSKAFRAFDASDFPQALKELDAIDARQPDLAASQNLRGVILMRQGIYDKAEAALHEAARIDPKFWNARFNLAEIPFLKKDWPEARNRFEQLLSSSGSDLASEATQLIQYKILLTYLLEGKENMVDSILAKLELSPVTPAVDYVKAAVALQHKNEKEAEDWMAMAEKNFSPQLNKLFAESLYEAGWLAKPAGEGRASLPIMTAAERLEKAKAVARSKFEQAQQALRQRDFAAARKLVDEADQAQPNQPATLNLRGEILMGQKEFDQAEATLKKAAKLDPKFREAQYNLAQIPFKKKEYAKARERFEALFKQTPGGDKNQASELIKFKIFMTLLVEGKESRAQAIMEQFQFTGDTPALYYAQAAWEYKHNNPEKAADWTASAQKIYSPALNNVFADAFYDVGWIQAPEVAEAPAPAFDTGSIVAAQAGGSPAVEPSPIPDSVVAASREAEGSKNEFLASSVPANSPAGMEATGERAAAEQPPISAPNEPVAVASSKPAEPPAAVSGPASSVESAGVAASPAQAAISSSASAGEKQQMAAGETKPSGTAAATMSATKLGGPAGISRPGVLTVMSRQTLLVGGLLLAGVFLLAWVIVPQLRRYTFSVPSFLQIRSIASSRIFKPRMAAAEKGVALGNGFFGGPRQVSLRLTASKPSLRRGALPSAKPSGTFDRLATVEAKPSQAPAYHKSEPSRESPPLTESLFESVGPVLEQTPETPPAVISQAPEMAETSVTSESTPPSAITAEEPSQIPGSAEEVVPPPAVAEPQQEFEAEPIRQEQRVPYEATFAEAQSPVAAAVPESAFDFPIAISTEPIFPQTTPPVTMPEPTQSPTAPINKPPPTAVVKPQATGPTQTSVQLTFCCEIAAMQLTPTFKMGVLKVRPASKVVTMGLAPSQQPQPGMNLQVGFEIVKIQPAGEALGTVRVIPSEQQRPTSGSPSFAVAGLQVVPNSEAAPVQLTPAQEAQAAVFVTVPFEITTLEFSPSLDIAAVILNSTSKQVNVQLPGAAPSPSEGAAMFEIANLQLDDSGDIAMIQLNLLGHGSVRA
jgi:Flp pilus assembly protein TadD